MALISEQSMKLYTAAEGWGIPYTKAEMGTKLGEYNKVLLDDLKYLEETPLFGDIQTAFIRFTYISPSSDLWSTEWLKGPDFKRKYTEIILLYSHWDFYTLTGAMSDEDQLEVVLFQDTCFGSIDISGQNSEEEVKTSCGTYKFARNDTSYSANISGYFEEPSVQKGGSLFTSLLLKSKFGTLTESFKGSKSYEAPANQVFWFMPFLMSKRSPTGYEGYALFKGTANQAGLVMSTESVVQQFTAPISVQSIPILILRDVSLASLLGTSTGTPEEPKRDL